jgi:threonine dehydrogenase-like Zn-dependent dehydrogenase
VKACVLNQYKQFEWMEVDQPSIHPDEVLIRTSFASICGSDQHIFSGEFHPRTKLPLIPGHEFAGTVVESGSQVRDFLPGDRVAIDPIIWCGKCPACEIHHYPACTSLRLLGVDLDGGFGEYVVAKPHMLYKLTPNITDRHGALVEVLGIGFHACNRAGVKPGDSVAIWGTGKVGHCILQAVRTRTQGPVFLIDLIDERLQKALEGYPDVVTVNPLKEDPVAVIREKTAGRGVDIAFEAAGHDISGGATLNPVRGCIQLIRGAGRVCVLGLGNDLAPVLFKELIWKEASIVASRVSHGEFAEVIRQMDLGNLKPDLLISDVYEANQVQEAFEILETSPEKHLKILLSFQDH